MQPNTRDIIVVVGSSFGWPDAFALVGVFIVLGLMVWMTGRS